MERKMSRKILWTKNDPRTADAVRGLLLIVVHPHPVPCACFGVVLADIFLLFGLFLGGGVGGIGVVLVFVENVGVIRHIGNNDVAGVGWL